MTEPPASKVEVAPFIRAQVGDPGRPRASLPPVRDLEHLPGRSGLVAGLRQVHGLMTRGVDHAREQVARYGRVHRHPVGNVPAVWIASPEILEQVTRNEDRVWSSALGWGLLLAGIDGGRPHMDSPGTLDFEPHKDLRRLLAPGFSGAALAGYVERTTEVVVPEIERWIAARGVAFKPAARRMFATVADRVFLGVSDPAEAALLDRAMADFWNGLLAVAKNPWISPRWRRAVRGYARLRETLRPQVAARRAGDRPDLFSRTCRAAPEVGWIDDDTLVQTYLGLLAAAFDTTSLGVTSMAYALATDPGWQERLREEARRIPGPVGADELKHLELCDRAWRETLRRYPVATALPRRPLRDVEVHGHRIPAGAVVNVMLAPLHFDPEVWTDPDRFDPDRFSPERAEDRKKRGAYLPFGAGAHACIGAQLSTMEAKTFWHAFLGRARFRLARPYRARHQFRPLGCVSGDVELIVEPL
jgi:cytochrome P450